MKLPLSAIAAACLLGLAACNQADQSQADRSAPSSMPPGNEQGASRVGQAVDDTAITAKVKAELLAEKGVNGTDISVETKQGQVTLSGIVPPAQIALAEEIARKVAGVREVVNRLEPASAPS